MQSSDKHFDSSSSGAESGFRGDGVPDKLPSPLLPDVVVT